MRRFSVLVLAVSLLAPRVAHSEMSVLHRVALSEGGAGIVRGLTFHAPLTDPSNPLALSSGTGPLAFTRVHDATHTATYLHPGTGLVTVASSNVLRVESQGALIEGAKTNLLTYSEAFTGWVLADGGSITPNTTVAPDGNTTAATLTDNTAAAGTELRKSAAVSAATLYTVSGYFKKTTGATTRPIFEVYFTGGAAVYAQVAINTNTGVVTVNPSYVPDAYSSTSVGDYWRVSVAKTSGAASTTGVWSLYPAAATMADPSWDPTLTGSINIWGAQLEAGNLSSYIPTGAAAMARNVDLLSVPKSGNVSDTAGTIVAMVGSTNGTGATSYTGILMNSATQPLSIYQITKLYSYDGTTELTTDMGLEQGVQRNVGMKWSGTSRYFGAKGVLSSALAFDGNMGFESTLYIGVEGDGQFALNGHIKDLRIWNRALTDAELQAVAR